MDDDTSMEGMVSSSDGEEESLPISFFDRTRELVDTN
jgi:hypothetical protein